jgi:peptidoglycan/LPS O-acetylase OafA/YrhL
MNSEFRLNNFDLLRILAATQVVLQHSVTRLGLPHPWFWPLVEAFPGVPVFFTISGFLISASYQRSSSLRNYLINRTLRIFPGLWCLILSTVLVASIFGIKFLHIHGILWLICQMLGIIFTPGFLRGFGFGSYNGSLWTIPVELQFYFALPLLFLKGTNFDKWRNALLLTVWTVFTAVDMMLVLLMSHLSNAHIAALIDHKVLGFSLIPYFHMFLNGVLMERWQLQRSHWIRGKGPIWLLTLLTVFFMPYEGAVHTIINRLLLSAATVSLAYTLPTLSNKLLRGNDISYGVYIYHGLIINVAIAMGYLRHWLYVLPVIVLTFTAGVLSWRLIECPFLRIKPQTIHPAVQDLHNAIIASNSHDLS